MEYAPMNMLRDKNQKTASPKKVIVLGNCVAERLQYLLAGHPGFADFFQLVPSRAIHGLSDVEQWQMLAEKALSCHYILSQPLFNFGPCNTETLREKICGEQRMILFSSPDFKAYFPDTVVLRDKHKLRIKPVLDWDSSIIFSCFVRGVSIFDVEDIYLNHRMFHAGEMDKKITSAIENYASREQGVDIPTNAFVIRKHAKTRLFHSPRHPVDDFLLFMLRGMAAALGLDPGAHLPAVDGFGFNRWPIITRHHKHFAFDEQAHFVIAGKQFSLEDIAMAYYNFYDFHPHVVEANMDQLVEL